MFGRGVQFNHVLHLRGNARTSGERRRREGGNVFGGGSRAPSRYYDPRQGSERTTRGL